MNFPSLLVILIILISAFITGAFYTVYESKWVNSHRLFNKFQKQRLEQIKQETERIQQELSRMGEELSITKRLVQFVFENISVLY